MSVKKGYRPGLWFKVLFNEVAGVSDMISFPQTELSNTSDLSTTEHHTQEPLDSHYNETCSNEVNGSSNRVNSPSNETDISHHVHSKSVGTSTSPFSSSSSSSDENIGSLSFGEYVIKSEPRSYSLDTAHTMSSYIHDDGVGSYNSYLLDDILNNTSYSSPDSWDLCLTEDLFSDSSSPPCFQSYQTSSPTSSFFFSPVLTRSLPDLRYLESRESLGRVARSLSYRKACSTDSLNLVCTNSVASCYGYSDSTGNECEDDVFLSDQSSCYEELMKPDFTAREDVLHAEPRFALTRSLCKDFRPGTCSEMSGTGSGTEPDEKISLSDHSPLPPSADLDQNSFVYELQIPDLAESAKSVQEHTCDTDVARSSTCSLTTIPRCRTESYNSACGVDENRFIYPTLLISRDFQLSPFHVKSDSVGGQVCTF